MTMVLNKSNYILSSLIFITLAPKSLCYEALSKEENLRRFLLTEYEPKAQKFYYNHVHTEWEHSLDLDNKQKEKAKIQATLVAARFEKDYWQRYFRHLTPSDYQDVNIQRQVAMLKELGIAALDDFKFLKLSSIRSNMMNIYSTAKICPYRKRKCDLKMEGLSLDPEIESIMAISTDYDELLYTWEAWRNATGPRMKEQFKIYVDLSNEAARANNFSDRGAMWRSKFESPTFEEDLQRLWLEVKPLYDELHLYVRNKLKLVYGDRLDIGDGLIPAHVLGNMWAQNWIHVSDLVLPFPDAGIIDVTASLRGKGYTPLGMFQTADEFYQSLGLESTSMSYNVTAGAMIEKPANRNVMCHASAWDFHNGREFRIKMCTQVNFEDFITIHHELGHIQYYQLYKNQPLTFRDGANPGFHEAVGDTIALSVCSTTHLQKIHLISGNQLTPSSNLNALMNMALERIAFLPFGLLIDKWRWDVFSGKVPPEKWNSHWWQYRETIQKVKPPISRSDVLDFDPGSKFHVPADTQYISYFVAHILEFQLHKALCIAAGQYDPSDKLLPLHKCDIYGSRKAGEKLRAGLSLGSSRHWSVALKEITGETELSGSAIIEYFQPLYQYLQRENYKITLRI
ncbi:hypothetical protein PPYR_12274 [Photinus pyralis]|uniref:Angiotensin-converting enzyme n=1 Tax=Photinus pyralis TaxID=7054 RepID=A0A5N4ADP0_PHOPY|nr:angiotensin-converting enzyme-like [Photinus pyralis]KAB0795435.1 hypothetical protein PPYR_12274 [Photinus pyralis]